MLLLLLLLPPRACEFQVRGSTKLEAFSNYLVDDGEGAAAGGASEPSSEDAASATVQEID